MFDLRHLRHTLSLAEHRNFAKAAKSLHLTQSALTRSIQALEHSLGERLFDRDRAGVELTFFGELFIRHAREIDLATRDLWREFDLARGLELGELRLGVGPFGAAMLVGVAVGQFNQRYPKLKIDVCVAPWQELPKRLREREIDLLIADVSDLSLDDDLQVIPLVPRRILTMCRAGHPLLARRQVTMEEMLNYPWAGPHLPEAMFKKLLSVLTPELQDTLRQRGLEALTCDSSSMLKAIILNSNALTVMNGFMVVEELRSGKLKVLSLSDASIHAQFGIVHLRRRAVSPAAQAFIDILINHDQQTAKLEAEMLLGIQRTIA